MSELHLHAVKGASSHKDLVSLIENAIFSELAQAEGTGRASASSAARRGNTFLIGPLGEVLLLDAVAAEAAGPLAALAGTLGVRRSLARTFSALGCAELGPQVLPRLADRLERSASGRSVAPRIAELGRLYQRYRSLLGPHRLDAALAFAQGARALSLDGLGVSEVVLHGLHRQPAWDELPTPHGMMQAIPSLLRKGQSKVTEPQRLLRVILPAIDDDRPALEQAIKPLLDSLYERHTWNIEVSFAPLGPEVAGAAADTTWGRFLRGLFAPLGTAPLCMADEVPAEKLSLSPLPSPRVEARHVARAVFDLLGRGVPCTEIAVIVGSAARRARLVEELARYDVPVRLTPPPSPNSLGTLSEREGEPLPPPLSLPLSLYELFGPEPSSTPALSRESLIALLTTRYLRWPLSSTAPLVRPWQIARALRGAGIRDLSLLSGADSAAELHRRIGEWQRQQKHPTSGESDGALLLHLEAILGELRALPHVAPLGQHVFALRRLCERLQLRRLAQSPDVAWLGRTPLFADATDGEDADTGGARLHAELCAAECRALARDQAALALFEEILDDLPRRAQRLRLPDEPLSRARFAALLRAAFYRQRPSTVLGRADLGVEVSSLEQLSLRPRQHLFVVGLLDGELPAAVAEDQLLDDEERRMCNRLLDLPLWPLSKESGQRAALYFAEALAHAAAVHLSWPIADEEGRPLSRSPLVDVVLHAAARGEPKPLSEPLVPRIDQARHPTELWTRAGQNKATPSPQRAIATPPALQLATRNALSMRDRRRAARLSSRVQLEASRTAWFTALALPQNQTVLAMPGPQNGQLFDPALIAALAPRLPGSRARPLSASALEDYARCPFRFFVYRVLQAAPIPEGGDDLDPLARGNLYHKVLETFFADRRDARRLPLHADDDDREALDRALDASLKNFAEEERGGHPGLFEVRVRRLRAEIWALIVREAETPIAPGCMPALLEHKFGPIAISAEAEDEESALHIGGIVDRIDIGDGKALVLDYKTGRLKRYQDYLRGELLVTSFQLPLYAAAVKADPAVLAATGSNAPQVTARFYAVRQAQVTEALDDPKLIALDPSLRREPGVANVAEAAHRLWQRLRGGDFRVAPRTCDGCGLEAVCRIAVPPALGERSDETGDDESRSSQSSSSATPLP